FKNSLGRYRMAVMVAALCQDLRVHYDPKREKELFDNHFFVNAGPYSEAERSFFSDSRDLFLHGLLSDKRYGTCASMPFLYVAIGRRLGYPVSVARTYMHFYVYYDEGGGKHFNVEATENRGFVTPSDDEYRNPPWGGPPTPDYLEKRGMLQPINNKDALAHTLATRASVFRSGGRHEEEARTWATAARYFADKLVWKEIADNMQQAALQDEYQKWRDSIRKDLASYDIPHGPGYAYFHDRRIDLQLFMDDCLDRKAIEEAAVAYKKELAEYSKVSAKTVDRGSVSLDITNQPAPAQPPLFFYYRPPDGQVVQVPADFMPPFAHEDLPMELKRQITQARPQDPDSLLAIVWQYYEQMRAAEHARQAGELERKASGNPVLISEESVPPEFRQGVPSDLGIRLSNLHTAREIAAEMWQYKQEKQAITQQAILTDPMAEVSSVLRQSGIPDWVARRSGLPFRDTQTTDNRLAGMPAIPGLYAPGANVPGMPPLATQDLNPIGTALPLSGMNSFGGETRRGNELAMELAQQLMSRNGNTPAGSLPYQVVPASDAANKSAVENPMPFGGLPLSPTSQLTLTPSAFTPEPANRNKTP